MLILEDTFQGPAGPAGKHDPDVSALSGWRWMPEELRLYGYTEKVPSLDGTGKIYEANPTGVGVVLVRQPPATRRALDYTEDLVIEITLNKDSEPADQQGSGFIFGNLSFQWYGGSDYAYCSWEHPVGGYQSLSFDPAPTPGTPVTFTLTYTAAGVIQLTSSTGGDTGSFTPTYPPTFPEYWEDFKVQLEDGVSASLVRITAGLFDSTEPVVFEDLFEPVTPGEDIADHVPDIAPAGFAWGAGSGMYVDTSVGGGGYLTSTDNNSVFSVTSDFTGVPMGLPLIELAMLAKPIGDVEITSGIHTKITLRYTDGSMVISGGIMPDLVGTTEMVWLVQMMSEYPTFTAYAAWVPFQEDALSAVIEFTAESCTVHVSGPDGAVYFPSFPYGSTVPSLPWFVGELVGIDVEMLQGDDGTVKLQSLKIRDTGRALPEAPAPVEPGGNFLGLNFTIEGPAVAVPESNFLGLNLNIIPSFAEVKKNYLGVNYRIDYGTPVFAALAIELEVSFGFTPKVGFDFEVSTAMPASATNTIAADFSLSWSIALSVAADFPVSVPIETLTPVHSSFDLHWVLANPSRQVAHVLPYIVI